MVGKRRFKIHDGIVRRRDHIFDILEILTEIIRSRIAVISGIELRHMVHDIACAQKGNIRIGKLLCLCIRRAGRGRADRIGTRSGRILRTFSGACSQKRKADCKCQKQQRNPQLNGMFAFHE